MADPSRRMHPHSPYHGYMQYQPLADRPGYQLSPDVHSSSPRAYPHHQSVQPTPAYIQTGNMCPPVPTQHNPQYNMTGNYIPPNNGRHAVPATQYVATNGPAGPQTYAPPVNDTSFAYGNSNPNGFAQQMPNVPDGFPPVPRSTVHHPDTPSPQFLPPVTDYSFSTTPHFAMSDVSQPSGGYSQNRGTNEQHAGQPGAQGYARILGGTLLPRQIHGNHSVTSKSGQQHVPNLAFHSGLPPQHPMTTGRANAPNQGAGVGPGSRPQKPLTRYCLPPNPPKIPNTAKSPKPSRPVNDGAANRPTASNGSVSHGRGSILPTATVPGPVSTPPRAKRRRADSMSPERLPGGGYKFPCTCSAVKPSPQPATKATLTRSTEPYAPAHSVGFQNQPSQFPKSDEDFLKLLEDGTYVKPGPGRAIWGAEHSPAPAWAGEPEHLPKNELYKEDILVRFVIEPLEANGEPGEALQWSDAIKKMNTYLEDAIPHQCIVSLHKFREISRAMERFVARPGRRALLMKEKEELICVRYAHIIEDLIAKDDLPVHAEETRRDYTIKSTAEKAKVVGEAWEKRA